VASAVLNLDKIGPTTSALSLVPNPTNGTANVSLAASASDSANGNHNIAAAEYWIDGGSPIAMTVNIAAPTSGLSANISAATVNALSAGSHTVSVRSQDALLNWGAPAIISLNVDKSGPTTSGVSAAPNPNNGSTPYNTSVLAVRVFASFSDVTTGGSNLSNAEGFLDAPGTTGTGFVFIATDGIFNSPAETGYADIPLAVVGTLSTGLHPICVHAKDAAGNWGGHDCSYNLNIDRLAPAVSGLTLTPSASNNTAVVISATATDVATGNSNIGGGEYFIDTTGAAGTGTPMTASSAAPVSSITATIPATTIAALTAGNHTIYVRAKDVAGNWSTTISAILLIDRTPPTFSSITLTPNSIPTGTSSVSMTVNGASDGAGGSGVVGGEYWFGTSNIPAGTGTAFSGLTPSIATGALTPGSYTVRVRIRDAAGNWSVSPSAGVRTATLTVTGPLADAIFSDGFETGNLSAWPVTSTANATRLNVTAAAALVGSFGMQAQGNNTNFAQFNFGTVANPATGTFDARFYFNPNGNTGTNQDIFVARTTGGTTIFRVVYRWNGGSPQVQIQIGTGTANTLWTNITNGASNRIEVVWQSGSTLELFVGGSLVANQSLVANVNSVGQFRLGSVAGSTSATLEYFDAFSAKRSVTPYGP
jgi:hypothetical protein